MLPRKYHPNKLPQRSSRERRQSWKPYQPSVLLITKRYIPEYRRTKLNRKHPVSVVEPIKGTPSGTVKIPRARGWNVYWRVGRDSLGRPAPYR